MIASKDSEIEDLKKRLKEAADIIMSRDDTISARDAQIAGLQSDFDAIRAAYATCDALIKELKAHLARVDTKLAEELEEKAALEKQLTEERRKKAELEADLKTTKVCVRRVRGGWVCSWLRKETISRRPRCT